MKLVTTNRVLVVDDEAAILDEYQKCLGSDFEPDTATTTLGDLERVLFGESTDEHGSAVFDIVACNQGEAAVDAASRAVRFGQPFAIVFLDINMPPGIDGIEAAKRIRKADPNINIVLVTGSLNSEGDDPGAEIPPADKVFFFQKPFHAAECRQLAAALCGKWHADRALRKANEVLEQRVNERTEELRVLAYFDPVTGLPNRLKLMDDLQTMIRRSADAPEEVEVLLIDIERFSFLNETLGYENGTELLRMIGQRLARVLHEECGISDAVVGRFGADEFACLIPAANSASNSGVPELVKETIELPFVVDERDIHLKASFGVASYPRHGRSANGIFRGAEAALHRSIRRPDSDIVYYHDDMQARAKHKFNLQAELRRAIENGDVVPHYQPQIALTSGNLAGAEALARWALPDGSEVPPSTFVPLSEEMGITDLLFESMLHQVLDAVARWRIAVDWSVPVSVNVSARQLRDGNLVSMIRAALNDQTMQHSLLNLELTETALLEDLDVARPILRELSKIGVGVHVDDFGTGYSSLSYLAELPVETLKIDRSFISKVTESSTNERVVQAIVALGKALDLGVIAEGIENERQLELARVHGCDLAQGYLIGKPMVEEDFLRWCDARWEATAAQIRVLRTASEG